MNQMGQDQVKEQISDLIHEILQKQKPMPKFYRILTKYFKTQFTHENDHEEQELNKIITEKRKQMEDMLPFPDKELKDEVEKLKEAHKSTYYGRLFSFPEHAIFSYLTPDDKKHSLIYQNLAINEHLRWVASLEMLGYTGPNEEQKGAMTKCDDVAMVHPGMVEWNDPDNKDKNKAFDHLLVKSSFELADTILKNHEESYEQARSEALKKALIKELKNQINPKIDQAQKEELINMIEQVLDEGS